MTKACPLADKVAALQSAAAYPDAVEGVRAIETHMSWVFIAGGHAYKLKKPVRQDRLDFRSLAARHFYCLEELRLNRRLAPGVYLDVVALRAEGPGVLRIGGRGTVVDWLVRMKALPAHAMLDARLDAGIATDADMLRIARVLARFHAAARRAPLGADAYRALLLRHIDEAERELADPGWHLPAESIRALCTAQRQVVEHARTLFDSRVAAGRVVEAHGDLRPEHVYLGEPLAIIDALEFSPELRMQDAIDEAGFLALECERLGQADMGRSLLLFYASEAGDGAPPALIHFHQSLRAASRAKLAIAHLREEQYRRSPKWRLRARQYLRLAASHMAACQAALVTERQAA